MRLLAGFAVAVILFAASADAAVYRAPAKSKRKTDFYTPTQSSRTAYDRSSYQRTGADPNNRKVRSPEKHKVERAPKPKPRKYSHFTEGP